ncbi:MAG: hypothetical protein IPH86_18925 [bacterium]|nr:hypothetical protein [bacterium]
MEHADTILTVSGILFGFLFAGFWWSLNRELSFEPQDRHFKFGYVLLFLSMALLGYFGIVLPLQSLVSAEPALVPSYRGILLALIGTFGYHADRAWALLCFPATEVCNPVEWLFVILTLDHSECPCAGVVAQMIGPTRVSPEGERCKKCPSRK